MPRNRRDDFERKVEEAAFIFTTGLKVGAVLSAIWVAVQVALYVAR